MLNNINRLTNCSPMKNAATRKIKHFPELFVLGPQINILKFAISEK